MPRGWLRKLLGISLLTGALWWVQGAHATEPVTVEILGELTVDAEFRQRGAARRMVKGTLREEMGKPVGGRLRVDDSAGGPVEVQPCAPTLRIPTERLERGEVVVPPDGTFCVWVSDSLDKLTLTASGSHFQTGSSTIEPGTALLLPRPRFTETPQTLDLGTLHLREDISFDFPVGTLLAPGERAQVVSNIPAFKECERPIASGTVRSNSLRLSR